MPSDVVNFLRGYGIQATAQRLAVLRAVTNHPHSSAEDVATAAESSIGTISRQAVYDTLSLLAEKGIIRRIQPVGSPARYEGRVDDNHHHVVCRGCGRVADVDCAVGDAPCLTAENDQGFQIDEAEVVYWGRCPQCRSDADSASGSGVSSDPLRDDRSAPQSFLSTHSPTPQ